jgi:outer membrane protein, heavy metal efflux system
LRFVAAQTGRPAPSRWDLDALTLAALYERPDMPIARAVVEAAAAGEETAAALPNPVLSLEPTYNVTTTVPSPWTVGPIVQFLVNSLVERPARVAEARAKTRAARHLLAVAGWGVRGRVRTALIALWAARRRVGLSERALALSRDYESAIAARFRAGLSSAPTLNAAELAQNEAALRLAQDRRAAQLARTGLAAALAVPETALAGVRLDFAQFRHPRPPDDLASLVRRALTARPDLLAALARYKASEAALRLAVLRQYPGLDLGPGYHFDQGDNKFILALSLPLPVLNRNEGPIAAARAARRLAAARFLAVQAQALAEIERARTDWRASRAEAESARRVLVSAESTLSRRRAAFAAGEIGRLRLIGAELARVAAERGGLAAARNERAALGELEAALYRRFF